MRRTLIITALVAVIVPSASSPAWAQEARPAASPVGGLVESMVDVGGRRLHLACFGTGDVPVLYEPGGPYGPGNTDSMVEAGEFLSESMGTRFCTYDRAGTGTSDPDPVGVRTFRESAADLLAILASPELGCPCVVLGESLGGAITLVAMAEDASNVAGLVLLDPVYPGHWDTFQALAPAGSDEAAQETDSYLVGGNEEFLDLPASFRMVPTPRAPGVPVIVVTHGVGDPPPCEPCGPDYPTADLEAAWQTGQAELARALGGRLVVAEGIDHSIAVNDPDLVFALVIEVLAAIEDSSARVTPEASPAP